MKQRQVLSLRRAAAVIEDKEEGKEDVETTRKLSLSGRMTLGQRNKKVVLLVVPEPRTHLSFCGDASHHPETTAALRNTRHQLLF